MRSEGSGEALSGGIFIEVEDLGSALEHIGREIPGLIVDPASGVGEIYSAAGTGHFKSAEAVQDGLDFADVAFRKQE